MKTFDDIAIRIGAIESLMPSIEKSLDDAFLESGGSPARVRPRGITPRPS